MIVYYNVKKYNRTILFWVIVYSVLTLLISIAMGIIAVKLDLKYGSLSTTRDAAPYIAICDFVIGFCISVCISSTIALLILKRIYTVPKNQEKKANYKNIR